MDKDIKIIEDLSLNAWPSHQMQLYDGWLLRFSYFYTHRTNCVEQIGASTLPLEEKLSYCEHIYKRWQTPCIFKVSPVVNPDLDHMLQARGYHIEHSTDVMTMDLEQHPFTDSPLPIRIENYISYQWIEGLFALKNTTSPMHRKIVPSMYAAIPKDVIAVSMVEEEKVIATGLGILDRDYIGLYAIHVAEPYRHKHYATAICTTILTQGRRRGATKAYLQVVSDNLPAQDLYTSLGFTKLYADWFRVKEDI